MCPSGGHQHKLIKCQLPDIYALFPRCVGSAIRHRGLQTGRMLESALPRLSPALQAAGIVVENTRQWLPFWYCSEKAHLMAEKNINIDKAAFVLRHHDKLYATPMSI